MTSPPSLTGVLFAIREKAELVFKKTPCLWQLKIAEAISKQDRDVVVVTPLNQLGQQSVTSLQNVGIPCIAINADSATREKFVEIENFKYRAIIVGPEQLMKPGGGFEKLLQKSEFTSRIISFVFDEAHCITTWGGFRPAYKELQRLHYLLTHRIPYMIASATLAPEVLTEVKKTLHIRTANLATIRTSTDRPNIYLIVRKIQYALTAYSDLAFLIPQGWKEGDPVPPKFLVFFDDIQESMNAASFLRSRLPPKFREKVKWFNSGMTTTFKEEEAAALLDRTIWGFCTTESFGTGIDIPNVELMIQWRAACSLSTIWQRWGCAARDRGLRGTAILFAEKGTLTMFERLNGIIRHPNAR